MDLLVWKKQLDEDEKKALRVRVEVLKDNYNEDELQRIIFSELDDIGLRSEYYIDLMEEVLKEIY